MQKHRKSNLIQIFYDGNKFVFHDIIVFVDKNKHYKILLTPNFWTFML